MPKNDPPWDFLPSPLLVARAHVEQGVLFRVLRAPGQTQVPGAWRREGGMTLEQLPCQRRGPRQVARRNDRRHRRGKAARPVDTAPAWMRRKDEMRTVWYSVWNRYRDRGRTLSR
jgi:hypothetical protein